MKKYYYNVDTEKTMTIDEVYKYYCEFGDDEETFPEYLNGCLFVNNGSLKPIESNEESLYESRLNDFRMYCASLCESFDDMTQAEIKDTIEFEKDEMHRMLSGIYDAKYYNV